MKNTTTPKRRITLLQMNFWHGRLYYPIDKFMAREKADILCAQEMLSSPHDIFPSYCTAETLLKRGHFDTFIAGRSRPSRVIEKGTICEEQCAIFTKGEITCEYEKQIILYDLDAGESASKHGEAEYYSLLHTIQRFDDGTLVHILTHHGRIVRKDEARLGHEIADYNFKRIAEYAAGLTGPIILSGDFNLHKEATSLQPLKEIGLINLNDLYEVSVARNEFSFRADEVVSHIFVNNEVVVEDYRIPNDNVSDHLPLLLTFNITKNGLVN
nr:endonuclease/exonuclease/phosphatase family protein [uncultured Mucilaginibacter sp.]